MFGEIIGARRRSLRCGYAMMLLLQYFLFHSATNFIEPVAGDIDLWTKLKLIGLLALTKKIELKLIPIGIPIPVHIEGKEEIVYIKSPPPSPPKPSSAYSPSSYMSSSASSPSYAYSLPPASGGGYDLSVTAPHQYPITSLGHSELLKNGHYSTIKNFAANHYPQHSSFGSSASSSSASVSSVPSLWSGSYITGNIMAHDASEIVPIVAESSVRYGDRIAPNSAAASSNGQSVPNQATTLAATRPDRARPYRVSQRQRTVPTTTSTAAAAAGYRTGNRHFARPNQPQSATSLPQSTVSESISAYEPESVSSQFQSNGGAGGNEERTRITLIKTSDFLAAKQQNDQSSNIALSGAQDTNAGSSDTFSQNLLTYIRQVQQQPAQQQQQQPQEQQQQPQQQNQPAEQQITSQSDNSNNDQANQQDTTSGQQEAGQKDTNNMQNLDQSNLTTVTETEPTQTQSPPSPQQHAIRIDHEHSGNTFSSSPFTGSAPNFEQNFSLPKWSQPQPQPPPQLPSSPSYQSYRPPELKVIRTRYNPKAQLEEQARWRQRPSIISAPKLSPPSSFLSPSFADDDTAMGALGFTGNQAANPIIFASNNKPQHSQFLYSVSHQSAPSFTPTNAFNSYPNSDNFGLNAFRQSQQSNNRKPQMVSAFNRSNYLSAAASTNTITWIKPKGKSRFFNNFSQRLSQLF